MLAQDRYQKFRSVTDADQLIQIARKSGLFDFGGYFYEPLSMLLDCAACACASARRA